jgi:uncharacterized membrane protein
VPALIALFLLLWVLHANVTLDGDAAPLPYLPLINPLDLAVALALIAAVTWLRGLDRSLATPETVRSAYIPLAAVTFIWLTAVLLRSMHHWALVPYQFDALMHSTAVQAALSLFWSLLALLVMVYAVRTVRRALWITGAALLAVVVTKLFLVDLSHVGGIARIVSFIGVGVLLLVIGYFAPVPPRAARQEAAA